MKKKREKVEKKRAMGREKVKMEEGEDREGEAREVMKMGSRWRTAS